MRFTLRGHVRVKREAAWPSVNYGYSRKEVVRSMLVSHTCDLAAPETCKHTAFASRNPMPNTLINVSNRLPVTVEEGRVIRSSGGLVAALEGLPEGQYETKWIGWPGAAFPGEGQRQEIARKLAEEHGCVPVFLSEEEATAFYEGFSNSSIWPLLGCLPLAQARHPQGARGNANFVTKAGEHFASHFELLGFALGPLLSGF